MKAIISPQVDEKEDKLDARQDAPKEHSGRGYVAHITNEWRRMGEIMVGRCFFKMSDRWSGQYRGLGLRSERWRTIASEGEARPGRRNDWVAKLDVMKRGWFL